MIRERLLLAALALGAAATSAEAASAPVTVQEAWCRTAPAGALAGACFFTLTARADDRLVSVDTPAAQRAEIHTMSMTGGVMRMRRLGEGLALPARKVVALRPGVEHLMIIGPKQPFVAGARVPLTLRFAKAAPVTLVAPVRDAPAPPAMSEMEHR